MYYADILPWVLVAGGAINATRLVDRGLNSLDELPGKNLEGKDTQEKTIRVAANVFEFIGRFSLAIGLTVAGLWMNMKLAPIAVIGKTLPWIIGAVTGLVSSVLVRKAV
ncbi:MAG: hypothetical protein COT85_02565 [Chlamydiae bacterium CG10_big_fil_rev_8_21_14_0_10_42_34]|nr:MAG: hypothetical protein COT85_02565 [Chlamydiae bacterium CG10_big_fil_rev_8_21_14_0_10_42_34]